LEFCGGVLEVRHLRSLAAGSLVFFLLLPLLLLPPPCHCYCCCCRRLLQLASSAAGVDVVKVVEAQPSLLVLDEASPLADWARLDTEQLAELIKVRGAR
jgi:hypothetical protein